MEYTDEEDYGELEDVSNITVPVCEETLKPMLGMSFPDFVYGLNFYRVYAEPCGFDIRKGTMQKHPKDGSMVRQYVYCNREGFNKPADVYVEPGSSRQKRYRPSFRCGCIASISFIFYGGEGCKVERFEEGHSYEMVCDKYKKYMKVNRKLGYQEKIFNMNCYRVNIGPSTAYRLFKETIGDVSEVGSIQVDWKNHARDRKAYIDGCDAHLILQKMVRKKETCDAFYYAYTVDKNDRLRTLFWVDPIARRNCSVFGDVVSFDCTYGTNRYKMIFAPFTGKDNHGKIVTFGAALLPDEDNTVSAWVFERFKECMGRSPLLVITDQDPAMKIAVERVFPESTHRLCMWHIMKKLPEKMSTILRNNEDFKKCLNSTDWSNMISPYVFEQQWNEIMVDFGLTNERWFCDLFVIRQYWIPSYFRDIPMSGVCRTTSIFESVNSFFRKYLSSGVNLVEFLMHFDSAMDAQREVNLRMNSLDRNPSTVLKTPLSVEKYAASVYTTSMFNKIQKDIEECCFNCSITNSREVDQVIFFDVNDGSDMLMNVTYNKVDNTLVCSCNKFVRDGMLCSHIFSIFKLYKWDVIPEKYIMPRWTRNAYSSHMCQSEDVNFDRCIMLDEKKKKVNKMISDFYTCIGNVEDDDVRLEKLMDGVSDLMDVLKSPCDESSSTKRKSDLFEMFYGVPKPDHIDVHPPEFVKTKGSGSCLKDITESIAARANKAKRKCSKCGQYGYHDARNCPNVFSDN